MLARKLLAIAIGATAMFPAMFSSALADDIDLYINNSMATGSIPYVMFSLDYRSNLGSTICNFNDIEDCGWDDNFNAQFTDSDLEDGKITFFEMLRAALRVVLEPIDGLHIGLMMSHNDSCEGSICSNGGYILSGFKELEENDSNGNKAGFIDLLTRIPEPTGSGHSYQAKEMFFEFFRYLTGQSKHNSERGYFDFGNSDKNTNLDDDGFTPSGLAWDKSIEFANEKRYISPIQNECSRFFTINFLFGVTNHDDDSDDAIRAPRANGGMGPDSNGHGGINLEGKNNDFSTVVRYLHDVDLGNGTFGRVGDIEGQQNVTSYFLFNGNRQNQVNEYAQAGGTGRALDVSDDPTDLINALQDVFSQILSVSTTFVSASIPVNVFNRAEFLDSVYVALFKAENGPRWPGNLKKLRLAEDEEGLRTIMDVAGRPAMDVESGRIRYNALTFWTDPLADDVQAFDESEGEIQGRDGRSVERGGGGQSIPGFLAHDPGETNATGDRKLFTEPATYTAGTPQTLRDLDATATLAEELWPWLNRETDIASRSEAASVGDGVAHRNAYSWSTAANYADADAYDQSLALNALRYARGLDSAGAPRNEWLLGDPLHSRPLPINYGARSGYSEDDPDIRILMGSNDGFMRMFRNTTSGGAQSGDEVWGFGPLETLAIQKRLMENAVDDPDTAEDEYPHPYGVDGAPTVYVEDGGDGTIDSGDKAYMFFGLRRGGKAYYALDITDPDKPKFLWKITNQSSGFEELGLTFSHPRLGRMDFRATDADEPDIRPIVIFGGGYDVDKDVRVLGEDDDVGNAIYIVEAETGELVWKGTHPELVDSIPAAVTAVDTNGDGRIDRMYVGDTGGNVWRADVPGGVRNSGDWSLTKLAELGRHSNATEQQDRRFFHAPDFVQTEDSARNTFDAIILGSGDRSDPMGQATENWLYMIKDSSIHSGAPPTEVTGHDDLADLTDNCYQDVGVSCTSTQLNANSRYGWRLKLEQGPGEKSLSTPLTLDGQVFYTTFVPPDASAASSCGPAEGQGLVYHLDLHTASAVVDYDAGNSVRDANGELVEIQKGDRIKKAGHGIPGEVIPSGHGEVLDPSGDPNDVPVSHAWRTYWYQAEE